VTTDWNDSCPVGEKLSIPDNRNRQREPHFSRIGLRKIEAMSLPPAQHAELVSGISRNQRLYWLVFVSRSDFAKSLWDKIRNVSGQGELL
jgi:hypothetical protein